MDGDPPTMASQSPDTTQENFVQAELWKKARLLLDNQLSEGQKRHYQFMRDTFEDVEAEKSKDNFVADSKSVVKEMEAFQQDARNKTRIRTVKVKNKAFDINFNTILHRLQVVINVGDAVVAYTPEIVSAVWGTLKLVFDLFQKPMALQETLADAVDRMVELIFVCRLYCGLYFSDKGDASKQVINKIPSLYATVLHFCCEAQYFARSNPLKKLAKTMFADWNEEFQSLSTSAQTGLADLHRVADISFKEAAMEFFDKVEKNADQKLHEFGEAIGMKVDSGMRDMQLGLERIDKENRVRKRFQETVQEHKKLFDWLLGHTSLNLEGPSEQLNTNLDKKLPGTCKWILSNHDYVKWSNEHIHNDSGVLWVSGDPGFGKSVLTASIIHRLNPERKGKSPETSDEPEHLDKRERQLLFFFCKAGDNRTQKSEKIIIHLLCQLFADSVPNSWDDQDQISAAEECNRIIQDIRPRQKNRDQAVSVRLYVLQTAFKKVAAAVKKPVFMIVDAVDECSDPKNLVSTLAGLVRKDGDVRLLFSSRPESNISEAFHALGIPKARVDVTKEVNQRDIGAYVKWWMKKLPKLSQRLQKEARQKICEKAGGQFRYASVAIESLVCAKGVADAQKALSSLPDSMSDFYRKNAQGLDEVHQKWLLIAFRWIICGYGSVDASIIADELETMFANEQDDQHREPYENLDNHGGASGDEKSEDDGDSIVSESDSDDEDAQRFEKGALTSGLAAVAQRGLPVHHGFLFDSDLRWSIRQLLAVAHDFLKIDSNRFVGLQHASVGDWITEDKRSLEYLNKTLCENCHRQIHSGSGSIFRSHEAAPEYGHLLMAAYIMNTLNNSNFQRCHILAHLSPDTNKAAEEYNSDSDSETNPYNSFLQRTKVQQADVRYELTHWPYHIRNCERAWPEKKLNTMAEQYKDIMLRMKDDLVKFMDPDSQAFKAWQRLTWPDRSQLLGPIHVAACLGLQNLMKTLLSQGSDLFGKTSDGETPLHLACLGQGEFQGILFLLRKMKEEIKQKLDEDAEDAQINEEMAEWINMKDKSGRTPLLCAVKSGADKSCVLNLLNYGADPSIGERFGYTCLHISASLRKEELCRLFISSGKNKNGELVTAKDIDGETPLHWLLKSKVATPTLAACLIESDPTGKIVNMKDDAFQTPLYEACKSGNVSCARELLKRGASIHDEDMSGWSPLNAAISTEDVELVELLLDGREACLKRQFSSDPIFQAAKNGFSPILKSLLSIRKGLDSDMKFLLVPDNNNTMLLHQCIQNGDYDIVKILLEQSEVRSAETMTLEDSEGLTPIGHAVSCWMRTFDQSQQTLFEDILLELSGCKPDSAELIDFLNAAIELGNNSVCKKFSHLGIFGTKDEHGWTSMQLAHEEQKLEILKIFQQQDSQITIQKDRDSRGVGIPPAAFTEPDEESLLTLVSDDGLEIGGRRWGRLSSVRADHPVPAAKTHYYYEVTILRCGDTDPVNIIGVGFCSKYFDLQKMPGWEARFASFGYHGDDGCFYQSDEGIFCGETYGEADTIGVALDFERDEVFFTKNGEVLDKKSGKGLTKGRLYPVVGMSPYVLVRANFGPNDFKFNWVREPVC